MNYIEKDGILKLVLRDVRCKTSGFNMEDTHIKKKDRLENFIKCLFIAYAITIKIGEVENKKQPIKIKKH